MQKHVKHETNGTIDPQMKYSLRTVSKNILLWGLNLKAYKAYSYSTSPESQDGLIWMCVEEMHGLKFSGLLLNSGFGIQNTEFHRLHV